MRGLLTCLGTAASPQRPDGPVAVNIADLEIGKLDSNGDEVLEFYGKKSPDFAVYRTAQKVSIQFADDRTEADSQRKAMAPLNILRGEINGLIDGWRLKKRGDRRYRRALRFDRRVGDALVFAFESDVPDAAIALASVKQDILNERIAWAQFEYLLSAFFAGVVAIVLMQMTRTPPTHGASLWAAAEAGAVGAFFSIAIGLRGRTVLPDLLWLANMMDAILRMTIGIIGASVLMALINLNLFKLSFGNAEIASAAAGRDAWLSVLLVGFLAGFSERLVPDLLATASAKPVDPPPRRPELEDQPAAGKTKASRSAGSEDRDQASEPLDAAASTDDTLAQEAAVDHCLCAIDMQTSEATRDEDLPAASGGVAVAAP